MRWRSPGLLLIFALFALYYYWTVQPHLSVILAEHGIHNQLADAFRAGQVSLLKPPDPRLLLLDNPYDPVANGNFRDHDLSLYKGKLYVYFGPTPALTLFLPFQLLTRTILPDRGGAVIFAVGALIAACLALKAILTEFYPSTPQWLYYFLCCALGFCNAFPFILRRTAVYEATIIAGQCFLLSGVTLLLRIWRLRARTAQIVAAAGAGTMFALAIGARASLVLPAALFLALMFWHSGSTDRWRRLLAASVPVVAALVGLAIYNYVRFDSPFEFGTRYQLAGVDPTKAQYFRPLRVPGNAYLLTLFPFDISATFPFVWVQTPSLSPASLYLGFEAVAGLLWLSPLLAVIPAAPLLLKTETSERRNTLTVVIGGLTAAGLMLLIVDGALGATLRYEADFSTLWFIAAATVAVGLAQTLRAKGAIVLLCSAGMLVNVAIGLTGYYGGLSGSAPEQFTALKNAFAPVEQALRTMGFRDTH